jgi:penicillin-binding protein 1A
MAVWYGNDDYSSTNRMTGGSLPAQTWHDIMVVAHQGVEIRDVPGIGAGKKLPPDALAAANANAKAPEINPGPPPILTRRGANILVRVEKLFDDAAKTVAPPGKTSSNDAGKPAPASSVAFPDSFASATSEQPATPPPSRKN